MTKEELIKILKNNLEICIDQETDYGPVEIIKVTLYFNEEKISSSSCDLPNQENF